MAKKRYMDNRNRYLVAVYVDEKCRELFFSTYLEEIPMVICKYPKHHIIIHDVKKFTNPLDSDDPGDRAIIDNVWRRKRGGEPTKIRCIENNYVFNSVKECSKETGIGVMNIYQSIHSGYAAGGVHFEYYFDEDVNDKQEVHGEVDADGTGYCDTPNV